MISNLRFRRIFFQVLLVVSVVAVGGFLIYNAADNLERQGIASGFGFLHLPTGFDIASSLIPYDSSSSYLRLFVAALLNTLLVSAVSIVFATIIGFSVGIMRLAKHPIVSRIAAVYVETLRNIPLLLQVFFWYFAVLQPLPGPRQSVEWFDAIFINNRGLHIPTPLLSGHYQWFLICLLAVVIALVFFFYRAKQFRVQTGETKSKHWWLLRLVALVILMIAAYWLTQPNISWELPVLAGFNFQGGGVITPEFFALFLALSTYTGAYIAENVRSGIQSVDKGQIEAGHALGLRHLQIMRFIVIPNAMRVIIPPLTNQYLTLTKNSSLAAAIAYPDIVLVFAGTALNQTGQAVEILLMVMLVYLFISLVISLFMNWYNARIKVVER